MKKKLLLALILVQATSAFSQSNWNLDSQVGAQLNQYLRSEIIQAYEIPYFQGISTSPVIGVELGHNKSPLSLSFNYSINSATTPSGDFNTLLFISTIQNVSLNYTIKKFHFGVGYAEVRDKNPLGIFRDHSISAFFGYKLKWLDVDVWLPMVYSFRLNEISALDASGIRLMYNMPLNNKPRNTAPTKDSFGSLIFNFGATVNKNIHNVLISTQNNDATFLVVAPTIGLEYYFKKYNFSLFFNRSYWFETIMTIQSGSNVNTKYLTSSQYNYLGASYWKELKNERFLKFGLSYLAAYERFAMRDNTPVFTTNLYFIRGISLDVRYPITTTLDAMVKADWFTSTGYYSFEGFDWDRLRFGLIYRFNPHR